MKVMDIGLGMMNIWVHHSHGTSEKTMGFLVREDSGVEDQGVGYLSSIKHVDRECSVGYKLVDRRPQRVLEAKASFGILLQVLFKQVGSNISLEDSRCIGNHKATVFTDNYPPYSSHERIRL